jgi:hypothetical protein
MNLFSIQSKECNAISIFFTLAKPKALLMNWEAKTITHKAGQTH